MIQINEKTVNCGKWKKMGLFPFNLILHYTHWNEEAFYKNTIDTLLILIVLMYKNLHK